MPFQKITKSQKFASRIWGEPGEINKTNSSSKTRDFSRVSKLKHWSTLSNVFKGLIIGGYIGSITLIIFLLIIIYNPSLNSNYILVPLIFFFFSSSFGAFIGSRLKRKK